MSKRFDDPNSDYNQKCLASLRKKYPTMTIEEMLSERTEGLAKMRQALRDTGELVTDDDEKLLAELRDMGLFHYE